MQTIIVSKKKGAQPMNTTRYSPKRDAILQCLRSTTCHPSAEWVYSQLKPKIPDLSLATVYRNLARFRAEGAVQVIGCVDGEDQDRHLLDMPHAAFAAMPPQEVERFHEKYGYLGLHWMQTGAQNADGYCYYDIVRGGMDKGVGLADLCAQMGLTLADAVAVGDSANDVGMLKAAGLSACMANGTPDAKAAADRIIGDVREDGVAALIEELWFDGPRAEPSGKDFGSAWGNIESAGGSL